jgi:ATP-dependent RNA helicase DDX49/DBP8
VMTSLTPSLYRESGTRLALERTHLPISTNARDTFASLGLNTRLCANVVKVGLQKPTAVQRECIPAILRGFDVVGTSQTGSGKTAAFALPILELLGVDPYGIFCLCLTPTRELASQIADQFDAFSSGILLRSCIVIGGESLRAQASALSSRPHVVVATPGRLVEHFLYNDEIVGAFSNLHSLVLDEADRLLEPGFDAELRIIMHNLPSRRRNTHLFSATLTPSICAIQEVTQKTAFHYEAQSNPGFKDCVQEYCFVPAKVKEVYLLHLLKVLLSNGVSSIIVFTRTIYSCELLHEMLGILGLDTVLLHSMKKQRIRASNLGRFKSGEAQILIATDIASRGLDIPTVDVVINYDVPFVPREYVHRIGRAGRSGRRGRAITLVSQFEIVLLHKIEQLTGIDLGEVSGVVEGEVLKNMSAIFSARREGKMKMSQLGGFEDQLRLRKKLKR